MSEVYKIKSIIVILDDDEFSRVQMPLDVFLSNIEPEIKKIAKKAASEVIRDSNDCG